MKTFSSILSILIVSLFSPSCNNSNEVQNTESKQKTTSVITLSNEELKNIQIKTDTMHQKNISAVIQVKGKIDVPPQNILSISVPLGGYLKYTKLLPGMPIKKGEVIAVLEDPNYIKIQEGFLSTKIKLHQLEKEYLRQKDLLSNKAVSEKSFEQIQADYETEKVKLQSLAEQLKLLQINPESLTSSGISKEINYYAPVTGYVIKVNASIGKYIQPTDILFEIINPDDIHLTMQVFEKDLQYLDIDQEVIAYTNFQPDKKYPCKIIYINKEIKEDRTTEVHCHFDKYEPHLIPGTYMIADIPIQNKITYVVPEDAVVFYDNKTYVFIEKHSGTFEFVPIKTGVTYNNNIEIQDYELLKGQKIIYQGAHALLMKLKNTEE